MRHPVHTPRFKEALGRVERLFVDTPGGTLTAADAARMAGLDRQVCRTMLRTLMETGVLEQRGGGVFALRPSAHPVAAPASLH